MAALQPAGKWLYTQCGSPHYAAPEIIKQMRYRGDRADIWSCGVILYAMLAGYLPFGGFENNTKVETVLAAVTKGEYSFPEGISREAKDLIRRILQQDPRSRIPMEYMWQHPLLRKYENIYRDSSDVARMINGPPPPLTADECGQPIKGRSGVDRELLRNLRSLWHSASEGELIEKLLNEE